MTDEQPLCHCGRPLRHTGHHRGSEWSPGRKSRTVALAVEQKGKPKFRLSVEREVARCHRAIQRLKTSIQSAEGELRMVEAQLGPLVAVLEAYTALALPAPAPVVTRSPFMSNTPAPAKWPASPVGPDATTAARNPSAPTDDDEEDLEPREADLDEIKRWAGLRKLEFRTWDDLPRINRHCEVHKLPLFKRRLGR